jgi:hypothetical protein
MSAPLIAKPIQRFAAVALAFTALLLAITMVLQPMLGAVRGSLDLLAEKRFAHARLTVLATEVAQVDPISVREQSARLSALLISAPDASSAAAMLQNQLRAALSGQTIAELNVTPRGNLLSATLRLSGQEGPLLAALGQLESGTPFIRITALDIRVQDIKARTIEATLTLEAQWQRPLAAR